MAKIIVSCRFQKSAKDIADLIRYMATREGVEKLPDTKKYKIATQSQHDLILSVVKHFPQSKKFLEYEDYYAMPTRENANEFLDAVAERYADRADELKGLVNYISNRPGVEKLGSHGLFTQFDMPIDLDTVAERVANHDGVTIRELFYGNIHPFERDVPTDSEGDKLNQLIIGHTETLKSTLNEQEMQTVEKLKNALTEQSSLCECEDFINGFRLGVRLMAESLYGDE